MLKSYMWPLLILNSYILTLIMLNSYIWLRVSDANHATICSCLDVIFCIMRQYTIVLILKYLFFKDFDTDYFFIIHSLTWSLQGQLDKYDEFAFSLLYWGQWLYIYIYMFLYLCIFIYFAQLTWVFTVSIFWLSSD